MKKAKLKMHLLKEDIGYSAYTKIGNDLIATQGADFEELKFNVLEATNLYFEDQGIIYAISDIDFKMDMRSFFAFYKVINAKALSQRIGMNQSLLAQYIKGNKKPSATQTQRILKGVQQVGRELAEVEFMM